MTRPNIESTDAGVVVEKLIDSGTPGAQIEFDPDEAFRAGAFDEDAVSHEDAVEASLDVDLDGQDGTGEAGV